MELQPIAVVIGVCTFKRPVMLRACLDSLGAQILPPNIAVQIVVVDNEPAPTSRAGVEAFAATCPFPVHYVHQPKRGIAAARNAILDKAAALGVDQIAMLDDDETADEKWVAGLMAEKYLHIPVLMGLREWVYASPPFWPPEKKPKVREEGAPARAVSTCNVRFSVDLLRAGLRFDESLGLSGGSDQRFFEAAGERGFAIHTTNLAVTYELVHPARLTYRFIIGRCYARTASTAWHQIRIGQRSDVLAKLPWKLLDIPRGCLELLVISPLALVFGPYRFKQVALRGGRRLACSAGAIAAVFGHLPQSYRNVEGH
jgi:succinoglycan biosynthesis protein ExoM